MTAAHIQRQLIVQLAKLQEELEKAKERHNTVDLSRVPLQEKMRLITRQRAAIHRVAGQGSVYADQCEEIMGDIQTYYEGKSCVLMV